MNLNSTPASPLRSGYTQPAEWRAHRACWLAWPSHGELWQENLRAAQEEFTALCRAIDADGLGEKLEILVPDENAAEQARLALQGVSANFHRVPFGDIWLRDTGPIFLMNPERGRVATAKFSFNGWGGKYVLRSDDQVSTHIEGIFRSSLLAAAEAPPSFSFPWILEGGSVEVDGEGTCLTTRQCLLNPNRNPKMNQAQVDSALKGALGVSRVLWLNEGLINDHTDGHIDTLARFVAPGKVVCMQSFDVDDPNALILDQIAKDLSTFKDTKGRALEVIRIPSPGVILDEEGSLMPASYVNFYIGNQTVAVPAYGSPYDQKAVEALQPLFPDRKVVSLMARAILSGGGAFHCITQQEPMEGPG